MRYNLAMSEARGTIVDTVRFAMPGDRPRASRMLALAAAIFLAFSATGGQGALAAEADLYTVSDIDVDVTAESAVAARDQAIMLAQRLAYEKLLKQLADADAIASLPQLDDNQIADLVEDFDVVSERTSTVRYIGEFNFHFRADAVRGLLEQSGVRYAVLTSPPVLVLPVLTADGQSVLWSDSNGWYNAWQARPNAGSLVPVKLPLGDLADMGAIDAPDALAGNVSKLVPFAVRYGAQSALVVEAKLTEDAAAGTARLELDARRYEGQGPVEGFTDAVEGPAGDRDALYAQAIERVMQQVQTAWKQQNLVSSTVQQTVAVAVPIADYRGWLDIRRRLAQIDTIQRVDVRSLRTDMARLDIVYVGDLAQLEQALETRSLAIADDGGELVLLPAGAAPAAPAAP
jgi:hypothetical protein